MFRASAHIAWFIFIAVLVVTGCTPDLGGNNTNTNSAPDGASNTATDPVQAEPDALPDKEAAYPYQLLKELAQVHFRFNSIEEALRLYELAINRQLQQTNTEDAENWTGFGDALAKANRKEEATRAYQRAVTIYGQLLESGAKPELHNFYVERLALLHKALGNEAEHKRWIGELRADENDWKQQVNLAGIHEQQKNYARAESCYKRALTLTEEDQAGRAEVALRYGAMLHAAERGEEAEQQARAVLGIEPATDEQKRHARRLLFDIYDKRGELEKLEFK